jgi:hypothetical protein
LWLAPSFRESGGFSVSDISEMTLWLLVELQSRRPRPEQICSGLYVEIVRCSSLSKDLAVSNVAELFKVKECLGHADPGKQVYG